MKKQRRVRLPSPFLRRLWVKEDAELEDEYPFNLPWVAGLELEFRSPVTILVGENGSGKSTLVEAIAALSGYDEAGGGKGYRAVDHSGAIDRSGALLAEKLRGAWLPKVTRGWFFKAETFFSVARYLDEAARTGMGVPPDFLSQSHGEGFSRFFDERMSQQGIYFLDEPESALSPRRQLELLRVLARQQEDAVSQIIMATHSPILMAVPGATLLHITRGGFRSVAYSDTDHFRLYRDFTVDPADFIRRAILDPDTI